MTREEFSKKLNDSFGAGQTDYHRFMLLWDNLFDALTEVQNEARNRQMTAAEKDLLTLRAEAKRLVDRWRDGTGGSKNYRGAAELEKILLPDRSPKPEADTGSDVPLTAFNGIVLHDTPYVCALCGHSATKLYEYGHGFQEVHLMCPSCHKVCGGRLPRDREMALLQSARERETAEHARIANALKAQVAMLSEAKNSRIHEAELARDEARYVAKNLRIECRRLVNEWRSKASDTFGLREAADALENLLGSRTASDLLKVPREERDVILAGAVNDLLAKSNYPEDVTEEVLNDPEMMRRIKEGEEDLAAGRLIPGCPDCACPMDSVGNGWRCRECGAMENKK